MSAVAHYREAVRLLALVPIDTALIPGTTDSAVIAQITAAGPAGLSLPELARVLRRPVAGTEQLLNQLLQAGHITRLPTGLYGVPAPAAQPAGSTSSPETSTSTTNVLLAALGHALLARAAVDLPGGTDLHDSHRTERG